MKKDVVFQDCCLAWVMPIVGTLQRINVDVEWAQVSPCPVCGQRVAALLLMCRLSQFGTWLEVENKK